MYRNIAWLIAFGAGFALLLASCGNSGGGGAAGSSGGGRTDGTGTAGTTNTAGTTGAAGTAAAGGTTGGTTGTAGNAAMAGAAGQMGGNGGAIGGQSGGGRADRGGAGGGSAGATARGGSGGDAAGASGGASGALTLTSPDQADNAKFGTMFTCAAMNGTFGAGVNPELDWAGVPAGTMSFAITFIDTKIGENMAMGQHWAAWDIPAGVKQLPKGTTALTGDLAGAKQTNKYLAPCPSGNDTYELTLYALSTATLNVTGAEGTGISNSAGVAKVLAALKMVTPLATAKLHGTSGPMGK